MRKRAVWAWGVAIVCFVVLMIVTPAIPQSEAYHDFADQREFFGDFLVYRSGFWVIWCFWCVCVDRRSLWWRGLLCSALKYEGELEEEHRDCWLFAIGVWFYNFNSSKCTEKWDFLCKALDNLSKAEVGEPDRIDAYVCIDIIWRFCGFVFFCSDNELAWFAYISQL